MWRMEITVRRQEGWKEKTGVNRKRRRVRGKRMKSRGRGQKGWGEKKK